MVSRLDQIYRSILLTKFFVRGWGQPENLRRIFAFRKILSNREKCQHLVDKNHPVKIVKEVDGGDHLVWEGEFVSPFVEQLPGLLPKESEVARFQMVLPKAWHSTLKPTCLHLAGTGDHGFWRRKMLMAKPLLEEGGIASIMLENPFYGSRKPKDQLRSSLHNVSDLFVMGGCLVLESLAIFHWCERMGFGPLGITGISMGGHMASLAATNWHKPLPLIPCLSWSTASGVFTQGVLSGAINWEMLKNQYFSNQVFRDELFKMIHSPEGDFPVYHEVGQKFARDFPVSLSHVERLMEENVDGSNLRGNSLPFTTKPKKNILQSLGLSKSKISRAKNKTTNILTDYRKSKSNISNPHQMPVSSESGSQVEQTKTEIRQTKMEGRQTKTEIGQTKIDGRQPVDNGLREQTTNSTTGVKDKITSTGTGIREVTTDSLVQGQTSNTKMHGQTTQISDTSLIGEQMTNNRNSKEELNAGIQGQAINAGIQGQTINAETQGQTIHTGTQGQIIKSGIQGQTTGTETQGHPANTTAQTGKNNRTVIFEPYIPVRDALTWEAVQFMRGIMDECTHLGNFSVPIDPSLIIIVAAQKDGYMPRDGIIPLTHLWPGSELRILPTGHVSAYLFNHQMFRRAIRDSFDRVVEKYYNEEARARES